MSEPFEIRPDENAQPVTDKRILRGEATRDRVLDAAERCFAIDGFDAVSIRQVATEADVTLGVVGFHCKSKRELFRTVLSRRVEALNIERRKQLAVLRSSEAGLTVRDLVDAYFSPYLAYASSGDPQWRAYAALIARIISDDRYYEDVRDLYDPVALEYMDAFATLFPNVSRERLATLFTLSIASLLSLVASRSRIAGLSAAELAPSPNDYREILIDFCTGGIQQALERETPPV